MSDVRTLKPQIPSMNVMMSKSVRSKKAMLETVRWRISAFSRKAVKVMMTSWTRGV